MSEPSVCPCDCFECRIDRHDICKHLIKCIRRPWSKSRPVGSVGEEQ